MASVNRKRQSVDTVSGRLNARVKAYGEKVDVITQAEAFLPFAGLARHLHDAREDFAERLAFFKPSGNRSEPAEESGALTKIFIQAPVKGGADCYLRLPREPPQKNLPAGLEDQ